MGKILIIDKDVAFLEAFGLLLNALNLPFEVVSTHSNATRIFRTDTVDLVFLNPELPMVDPKALLDEFEGISADKRETSTPVIFLYTDMEIIHRYELTSQPNSQLLEKPVPITQLYEILDQRGLTQIRIEVESQRAQEKISHFAQFIEQSESWLERLRDHLVKS